MPLSGRDYRNIIEIIDVIHSVPDHQAMFREVCTKLEKLIGIYSAIFVPADPITGAMIPSDFEVFNMYEGVLTLYLKHYAALDPLRPPYNKWCDKHLNVAFRNTELVPEKTLLKTEFVCDFLIPLANVFHILASTIGVQGDIVGLVGFHRQRQAGDFSGRDKQIVNILLPHMARAIHNRSLMNRISPSVEPDGVIAIGENGKHFFMNDSARNLLGGIPVESIPDPGIGPDPVYYRCKAGTYRVRTMPLTRHGKGRVVVLERYPPNHKLRTKLDGSGLSRRETEICVLVIQGYSNREIAERLFICEQTVKDHLHVVFQKFEIRSRGELTARILGLRSASIPLRS